MESPLNTNACFHRGSVLIVKVVKEVLQKKNINYTVLNSSTLFIYRACNFRIPTSSMGMAQHLTRNTRHHVEMLRQLTESLSMSLSMIWIWGYLAQKEECCRH